MIGLFCFLLAVPVLPFKSKLRLEAENAVLRHQLIVLRRRLQGRVRLTNHDRWFFVQLTRIGFSVHTGMRKGDLWNVKAEPPARHAMTPRELVMSLSSKAKWILGLVALITGVTPAFAWPPGWVLVLLSSMALALL
jgi:hypothetical protein